MAKTDHFGVLTAAVGVPVAAGLLVLMVLAVEARPAGAAFPGKNGKIVFTSNRDGNYEIYTMNSDGTGLQRVTNDSAGDIQPSFSGPAGGQSRVAFTRTRDTISNPPRDNYDIYWANSNGTGQEVRLTTDEAQDSDPAISPDGNKIAFRSRRDGNSEIYTAKLDGTGLQRITNNPAPDLQPNFSPNGSKIAFTSTRDGESEIYTMNTDGTGVQRVTNEPGGSTTLPPSLRTAAGSPTPQCMAATPRSTPRSWTARDSRGSPARRRMTRCPTGSRSLRGEESLEEE